VSPELDRPLPPYVQIVEHYRALITTGQLKDGDRLPSTRQIVEQWKIAHATAAKALATLRSEGLVRTVQGGAGGTIVSVQGVGFAPRDRMLSVRRWGRIYPPGEHARIVAAELVDPAPDYVLDGLGLTAKTPQVIRRHRITFRDETPVSLSTSWFAGELAREAPALLIAERIPLGTPGYIEQQTGRRMAHGRDQLTPGLADAGVAGELAIAPGTPVLLGRNWVRDVDGGTIEFGEYVSVPSRYVAYEYEIQ
jgi:DNA-binding GntR family transcriptional regulator